MPSCVNACNALQRNRTQSKGRGTVHVESVSAQKRGKDKKCGLSKRTR